MKILAAVFPALYSISALACFAPMPSENNPLALDTNNQVLKYCKPYAAVVFLENNYEGPLAIHTEKISWWRSASYLKINKSDNSKSNHVIFEPSENSEFKCKDYQLVSKNNKPIISTGKAIFKDHYVKVRFINGKNNKNYLNDNLFFMLTGSVTEYTIAELSTNISCDNYDNLCHYSEDETNYNLKFYPVNN